MMIKALYVIVVEGAFRATQKIMKHQGQRAPAEKKINYRLNRVRVHNYMQQKHGKRYFSGVDIKIENEEEMY